MSRLALSAVILLLSSAWAAAGGCNYCMCSYNEGYFTKVHHVPHENFNNYTCHAYCKQHYPEYSSPMTCYNDDGCFAHCKTGYAPDPPTPCNNVSRGAACNKASFPNAGCPVIPLDPMPYTRMADSCLNCQRCTCKFGHGSFPFTKPHTVDIWVGVRATHSICAGACKDAGRSAVLRWPCDTCPSFKCTNGCEEAAGGKCNDYNGDCVGDYYCRCPLTGWMPAPDCSDEPHNQPQGPFTPVGPQGPEAPDAHLAETLAADGGE